MPRLASRMTRGSGMNGLIWSHWNGTFITKPLLQRLGRNYWENMPESTRRQYIYHMISAHMNGRDFYSRIPILESCRKSHSSTSPPNHYPNRKRLVVCDFLCGNLWVRDPTKIKTTLVLSHKKWTTTLVLFGIIEGKTAYLIDISNQNKVMIKYMGSELSISI